MPSITSRAFSTATAGLSWASEHAPVSLPIIRRMGARVAEQRRRAQDSPNYRDGRFRSPEPTDEPVYAEAESPLPMPPSRALSERHRGRPGRAVPLAIPALPEHPAQLAVTWLGHATSLLELDGHWFLFDPVFGERCSPVSSVGPRRLHPAPIRVAQLPHLDAVVISHDHYDHLDEPTIRALEEHQQPRYVVPVGVDAHLRAWGVAKERITALDWREDATVGSVRVTATEARHFSGRGLVRDQTLWAGWALHGPAHSAWFTGDSGPSHCFADIGRDLGPFDLTIVPIGAYDDAWPDIHVTPEQGVDAHMAVMGDAGPARGVMLPVHWATFNLAMHWWAEPIRRARSHADERGVPLLCPRPGQRTDLDDTLAASDGNVSSNVSRSVAPQADWWSAVTQEEDRA